jgi:hypothetical protein
VAQVDDFEFARFRGQLAFLASAHILLGKRPDGQAVWKIWLLGYFCRQDPSSAWYHQPLRALLTHSRAKVC